MELYETTTTIKGPAMKQEAILFTRDNAAMIAANLTGYTAEELLDDYEYMFENHHVVVLARDILADGFASISYVVTRNMFEANNPGIQLNDETFTHVRNV